MRSANLISVASTPRDMATVPDLKPKKVKRAPLYHQSLIDEASQLLATPANEDVRIGLSGSLPDS